MRQGGYLGIGARVLFHSLQQSVGNRERYIHRSCGRDGLRVQSVHVLAGRKDVRVADRVAAGAWGDVTTL